MDCRATVAAGKESSFFICDGTVWVVGSNIRAILGIGADHKGCRQPTQLNMESNIVSVSASKDMCLFLDENGRVYQVGTPYAGSPIYVPKRLANLPAIKAIFTGFYGFYLIDHKKNVWICGFNPQGGLGTPPNYSYNELQKLSTLTNIQQISAGENHTLFLDADWKVWGCGSRQFGKLGQEFTNQNFLPQIIKNIPPMSMVSAGNNHSMFLDFDGRVWVCGTPKYENESNVHRMESVVDVVLIHAAVASCFAVDKDGVVYQAGTSFNLNIENNGTQFLPVKQFSNIIEIASSQTHILFVDASGSVWSFGKNVSCQLALGHREPVEEPQKVLSLPRVGWHNSHTKSGRKV